jgi:putative ABC transport system permease protein
MGAIWLRWSWRDFRARWLQVLATALILAFGIGTFAGFVGLREWTERSADESFAAMRAHDLRVDLAEGDFVAAGRLRAAAADLPDGMLAAAEERLVANGQLNASRPGDSVLVPARIVGLPLRPSGQAVDGLAVKEGRTLAPSDARRSVAVLDWNFAQHFGLPPAGRVRLAGLGRVPYVGLGVTPQHVLVLDESGMTGGEAGLGTVYLPLAAAQRAAGRAGEVNELVLRLAPGQNAGRAERALRRALGAELPGLGVTVTRGDDEPVQRILYRDARNDQKIYIVLATLVLAGGAFAAFNLVSRVVEAQRREIGIGMALGVEPRLLALRPLLLGVQIAAFGVALGIPMAAGLSALVKGLFEALIPLPVYAEMFPTEFFLLGALIGLVLPPLAAALPVRRAVGVAPVEAIRVGFRAAKGGGAAAGLRRLRVPGGSVAQLPVRNLARALRRTVLTVLGLGAVITVVVATLAMFDAIGETADREEAEVLRSSPDRLDVSLAAPEPVGGPAQRRVADVPGVRAVEPGLVLGGRVRTSRTAFDVALRFVPRDSRIWTPSVEEGAAGGGILLARRAADDLGVGVGDTILLRHPRRAGDSFAMARSRVRVSGIHGSPVRAFAYLDSREAGALGLGGLVNTVAVLPGPAVSGGAIERALFGQPGIASVRPARANVDSLQQALASVSSAIGVMAAITLGMALLVAFTSTSVSVDERRREYATMFAFGLPARAGLRVAMTESLVTGLLGTAVGLGLGLLVVAWMVTSLFPDVVPDLGIEIELSAASVIVTLAVGIVAVTLAPLFTFRRMRRMDIPSTLRVME